MAPSNSEVLWKIRSTYVGNSSAAELKWATPVPDGQTPDWQSPTDAAHELHLLTQALREKLLGKADLGLPATTSSDATVAPLQDAILAAELFMHMPRLENGVAKYNFRWLVDGRTLGAVIVASVNLPVVAVGVHRVEGLVPVEAELRATALGVGLAELCTNESYYKSLAAEMAKPEWETSMARQIWLCRG